MRPLIALLFALSATIAAAEVRVPQPNTSRPMFDMRYVVGLVPTAEGVDAYWVHLNERAASPQPTLFRTKVGANGGIGGTNTVLLRSHAIVAGIEGQSAVQALWLNPYPAAVVSPIIDGVLKYPEGKPLAQFGFYPALTCGTTDCVASWETSGKRVVAILDADSNVVSGPFTLPIGWSPQSITIDAQGIFFVRHTIDEVRAALLTRAGVLKYDVAVTRASTLKFEAAHFAVAFDGTRHVVAFTDAGTQYGDVRVVTIDQDGNVSAPMRLFRPQPAAEVSALGLAWNGSMFLLAGNSRGPFVMRFDSSFTALDPQPRSTGVHYGGSPLVRVSGSDFVIAWLIITDGGRPQLTIVGADGRISSPITIGDPPRRRSVRR